VVTETKFFAIVFLGNPRTRNSILNACRSSFLRLLSCFGCGKSATSQTDESRESLSAKLRARDDCTRVFVCSNMARMVCDKKNKGPAKPGLVVLFSFCQHARRAAVRRSRLAGSSDLSSCLAWRAYFAAASLAIECESRDTFRLAWFL
jgi:hypothetical protein